LVNVDAESANAAPRPRAVVLGASNVARGISTVVETARLVLGGPVDFLAAFGHGRSYGVESKLFGRTLSGITRCGLWKALADQPPRPTWALLTDVGNDLLYGARPDLIAQWVEQCLDRLVAVDARVVMTALPLENLRKVPHGRIRLMRSVLFPHCRLEPSEIVSRAHELDERLSELATARGCAWHSPRAVWYGVDPIHVKFCHWASAWGEILANWAPEGKKVSLSVGSFRRWIYLRRLCPQHRRWLGIQQRREQPSGRLRDGTTVALY
jgi:hypothetical protein